MTPPFTKYARRLYRSVHRFSFTRAAPNSRVAARQILAQDLGRSVGIPIFRPTDRAPTEPRAYLECVTVVTDTKGAVTVDVTVVSRR
jgi:hypothetical protein